MQKKNLPQNSLQDLHLRIGKSINAFKKAKIFYLNPQVFSFKEH